MMTDVMSFISATTDESEPKAAIEALLWQLETQTGEQPGEDLEISGPDMAFVFFSSYFNHDIRDLSTVLRSRLKPDILIGCTAEGIIGNGHEIENEPAISLLTAHLPQVKLTPFSLLPSASDWHRLLLSPEEFRRTVGAPVDTQLIVLLADPFSTPTEDVLQAFNSCYMGIPIAGGLASGALRPNGNSLLLNDQVIQEGTIGLAFSGALEVDVIVSQGCRPVGRPFKVVSAHRNEIYNLEGRPPLAWIQDILPQLPDEDRALLQSGLLVGKAINPRQESLGRGDFVIRGLTGIDQESGAITISDSVMDGEIIQFHLRDAVTAQEDLEMMLIPQLFREPPCGGLLFACNGRGTRLYDHPDGDISIIQQNLELPNLAGFFCAGEIGPVGRENYLHGHTISLALFRPPREESS
jgi:small ligand-binding sensory domain FIST